MFLCSSIAVVLGFGQTASSEVLRNDIRSPMTQNIGCADCPGTCFAGHCLFGGESVDDADTIVGNTMRQSNPPWPEASRELPRSQAEEPPIAGSPQRLSFRETSSSPLENKGQASSIAVELAQAEAEEARLQSENAQLRQQLAQWKQTGAHIAEREAKVVEILNKPSRQGQRAIFEQAVASAETKDASSPSGTALSSPGGTALSQQVALLGSHVQSVTDVVKHNSYTRWILPVILVVVAWIIAYLWKFGFPSKRQNTGEISWREKMAQALMGKNIMRKMGWAEYKVEVSEIHLGSFFAGSYDVRVTFRMPNGSERRTKVLKNSGGAFLRFDDVLELSLSNNDSPCSVCVGDRQGNVAQVELPGAEFIRLVHRPHQEYFRTELKPCRTMGETGARRPYVAMRLRDITAMDSTYAAANAGPSFAV